MALTAADLQTIRAAKDKLLATAAHYDELAAKARSEAVEYEIAERVFLKFAPIEPVAENNTSDIAPNGLTGDSVTPNTDQGKPPGIPTVPAMITEALTIAQKNRLDGLEPSGVVEHIRAVRVVVGAPDAHHKGRERVDLLLGACHQISRPRAL